MQAAYSAVGRDYKLGSNKEAFIGSEYPKLQRLESIPQRWPLARLSIPLQKSVDHLDRVLAGSYWEVHATRADPKDSLSSAGVERPYNAAGWLSGKRSGCHPQGDTGTSHQKAL